MKSELVSFEGWMGRRNDFWLLFFSLIWVRFSFQLKLFWFSLTTIWWTRGSSIWLAWDTIATGGCGWCVALLGEWSYLNGWDGVLQLDSYNTTWLTTGYTIWLTWNTIAWWWRWNTWLTFFAQQNLTNLFQQLWINLGSFVAIITPTKTAAEATRWESDGWDSSGWETTGWWTVIAYWEKFVMKLMSSSLKKIRSSYYMAMVARLQLV